MNIKKLNIVKKNFYFAMIVVALLFVVSLVIAAYDTSKASHGILYTDRIETKSQSDDTIEVAAKLDMLGLLINGQPFTGTGGAEGYWTKNESNLYYNEGNIGIGTATPAAKLDVTGPSTDGVLLQIYDSSGLLGFGETVFRIQNSKYANPGLSIYSVGAVAQHDPVNGNTVNLFNALGNSYITGGNVGIGTTTPTEKLEVNGNIKANKGYVSELCLNSNCKTSWPEVKLEEPLTFEVYNSDTTTWTCVDQNLKDICGDEDGCTIRIEMQHEVDANDQVKVIDEQIFMEQPSMSNNRGTGVYGHTWQGNWESSWITGTAATYVMFRPWDWIYMTNYKSVSCPGGNDKAYSDSYKFTFMTHPNVRAKLIIYDSQQIITGGGSSLPTCSDGQILKYNSGTGKWECSFGGGTGGNGEVIETGEVTHGQTIAIPSGFTANQCNLHLSMKDFGFLGQNKNGGYAVSYDTNFKVSCQSRDGGNWLDEVCSYIIICGLGGGGSAGGIGEGGTYTFIARFTTKYNTVMANPVFNAWVKGLPGGGILPNFGSNDHGWYIRNTLNNKFNETTDKFCEFFVKNGKPWLAGAYYSGGDYGSDSNNVAYYWDETAGSWKSEGHGDNGAIDIVYLVCVGDGLMERGSSLLEAVYGSYIVFK